MNKIFLFDCDQTIWTSGGNDYISSVDSPLALVSKNSLIRVKDGKVFTLKQGVHEMFNKIYKSGGIVGIVSDNKKDMVVDALKLFDIYKFINIDAINIKLWKGYCPKHQMVEEILSKIEFENISIKNVYWFDDKDYSEEAEMVKVNYIKVDGSTDFERIVKSLIG